MGPKKLMQAEANAENNSGNIDVGRASAAPHHMGGRRRPPECGDSSCSPLVCSAFASACIFCVGPILFFNVWQAVFVRSFCQLPCVKLEGLHVHTSYAHCHNTCVHVLHTYPNYLCTESQIDSEP